MKTAVVFFSLEGNTRFVAERIAEKLNADLIELKPVKAFPTGKVSKFFWGGKSATFKEKPELESYSFRGEEYDTVVIGTPLWAWSVTPPLRTFLLDNSLEGKRVAAFISCGGGDATKAFASIRELARQESLTAELKIVNPLEHKAEIDSEIEKFCGKIKA